MTKISSPDLMNMNPLDRNSWLQLWARDATAGALITGASAVALSRLYTIETTTQVGERTRITHRRVQMSEIIKPLYVVG